MPDNLPTADLTQRITAIQNIMKNGVTTTTADLIGQYTAADSDEARAELWGQFGPEVFEAAETMNASYTEATWNGEFDDDIDFNPHGDEDYLDGEIAADEAQDEAPLQITNQDANLLRTATALAPRTDAGREVGTPIRQARWHNFPQLTGNAHFAKEMAPAIFSMFPCYGELQRRDGREAASKINASLKTTAPPRGELGDEGRALLQDARYQGMNRIAGRDPQAATDVDVIGAWIRDNALPIGGNTVNFPQLLPNYEPEILFAVSEDETFVLVRESTQNDRSPVDMQYIYSWPGGREYYADHPEAVVELTETLNTPGGITKDFSVAAARLAMQDSVRKATERLTARQDRKTALPAQSPTQETPQLATDPNQEKAPVTKKAATPVSDKPVTLPEKKAAPTPTEGKPFKPMPQLQKQGFTRKALPNREQAMQQEVEDGFLTILPRGTNNLAAARDFAVEFREDALTPGDHLGELSIDDGREAFFSKLQEMIEDRPTPGQGMGPR